MIKIILNSIFVFSLAFAHFSYSSPKEQKTSYDLLGHFVHLKSSDSRNISGHEFYFYLETGEGKQMAYPVVFKDKNIVSKIKSRLNISYLIKGKVFKKLVSKGEFKQSLNILSIEKVSSLELKDISIGKSYDSQEIKRGKAPTLNSQNRPDKPIIKGINNTATNTAIFTAGAALLASILLGK